MESFRDYVSTENLVDDNRYDAGPHGLQVFFSIETILFRFLQSDGMESIANVLGF